MSFPPSLLPRSKVPSLVFMVLCFYFHTLTILALFRRQCLGKWAIIYHYTSLNVCFSSSKFAAVKELFPLPYNTSTDNSNTDPFSICLGHGGQLDPLPAVVKSPNDQTCMFLGLWEEAGEPRENPLRHWENTPPTTFVLRGSRANHCATLSPQQQHH